MARLVRDVGRALWVLVPLVAVAVFLALPPSPAGGGTYASPFWTPTSSNPACVCDACGCEAPAVWSAEGVSHLSGGLRVEIPRFTWPGLVEENVYSLTWFSEVSGVTQFGRGVLPSFLVTAEKVILNQQNPNGNGGHEVVIRRPDGLTVVYDWDGSDYSTSECLVHDTLTTDGSGNHVLTDRHGNEVRFNGDGMPASFVDRNGNTDSFTWSGYALTRFRTVQMAWPKHLTGATRAAARTHVLPALRTSRLRIQKPLPRPRHASADSAGRRE